MTVLAVCCCRGNRHKTHGLKTATFCHQSVRVRSPGAAEPAGAGPGSPDGGVEVSQGCSRVKAQPGWEEPL